MRRNGVDPSWHVTMRMDLSGRTVAQFGHRKGNAGWIWDELVLGDLEYPMTEYDTLCHIHGAVLEFLSRRA